MKKTVMLAAMVASTSVAGAATIIPNDESGFATVLTSYYRQDFSSSTMGSPLNGSQTTQDYGPVNAFSYHAFSAGGLYSNTGGLSTYGDTVLTITFTGAPVNAVGGIIAATDDVGATLGNMNVTAQVNDGTSYTLAGSGFVGFMSDTPITSITITGRGQDWPQLNDFYVGVPEPASLGLFFVVGAALMSRRHPAFDVAASAGHTSST